jgi:uncharacterized protein (TIGR02271 family)
VTRHTRETDAARDQTRTQEPAQPAGTERLERIEERLDADVETVQSGRVRIGKHVVEEPEVFEVTLRHDEIDLERRSADRPLETNEEPIAVRGDETVVLVIEERVEVRKVPWVVEEIHLRRRVKTETTRIEDTVRKQRWEISSEGEADLEQRQ